MTCVMCSMEKEMSEKSAHLCLDCERAENNRYMYVRNQNYNWVDVAKEAELELWERQPGETDREYEVWLTYRDAYPSIRPSSRLVAEQLGTTVNVVSKVARRWDFSMRLQAWAKHCDELTIRQREQEIVDMNKKHIAMATTLNQKIEKAIEKLDPTMLKPTELQGLMKMATDLERKARLEMPTQTGISLRDENPEIKDMDISVDNIGEILKILGAAGALNNVGVRKTVTTEVVVKDDD